MSNTAMSTSQSGQDAGNRNGLPWVLIIEDSPVEAAILKKFLSSAHCEVVHDNGLQAWNIINSERRQPCLVLLDLVLPNMSGMQLLDHIRSARRWRDVPIIVVSGQVDESTVVRQILASGVAGIIAKPFDAKRMRRELERFLSFKDETPEDGSEPEPSVKLSDDSTSEPVTA